MRQVSGVGVIKAQKYGKMFLEEIQSFQPGSFSLIFMQKLKKVFTNE